jgi:cardiolipin synthase A/B
MEENSDPPSTHEERLACPWPLKTRARACVAMLLVLLSACKSLPTTGEMAEEGRSDPVRLKSARGPLSVEQSAAILKKLAPPGDVNLLQRHVAVEEAVSESPLVVGNKVTLLRDGPATYKAMFAAVRAAKHHINLETYIIEDDEVGRRLADHLLAARARNVQVNLIYDSVGALGTPRPFFDRLREGGIRVLEFNPVNPLTAKKGWQINNRDHRKLLVVDGRVAFIGGINISSVYSSGSSVRRQAASNEEPERKLPWRDTHLQIEGPVVADFQKLFTEAWERQGGSPLSERGFFPRLAPAGGEIVRAVGSRANEAPNPIYVTLISSINSAETSVHLTNAYFVPDPQLLDALKRAVQRGVDVKLILPSRTDFWAVFHAGRSFYSELLEAGVKIYERRDALLHSKTVIVDGVWSMIGSTNLDWRSFVHNEELNAVVLGAAFSESMKATFEADLAASEAITPEQWSHRPLGMRLKETLARMWEYWL